MANYPASDVRRRPATAEQTVVITWSEYVELCRYRDEYTDLCRDRDILDWLEKDKARADAERGRKRMPLRRIVGDLLSAVDDFQAELYQAALTVYRTAARRPRNGPPDAAG